MPEFEASVDVEVYEIIDACSRREKLELVGLVIEECQSDSEMERVLKKSLDEHFPGTNIDVQSGISYDQELFLSSLKALASSYYQLSNETIESINSIAKPYR